MMDKQLIFCILAGFILASSIGVLGARRMGSAAFALFSVLIGVAAVFALLGVHMAAAAQVVLYVGGVMVLVAFALFLYPEPLVPPRLIQYKQHLGKAAIVLIAGGLLGYVLPWSNLNAWAEQQEGVSVKISNAQDLPHVGRNIIAGFSIEYELTGLLLFGAVVVGGWFIKSKSSYKS